VNYYAMTLIEIKVTLRKTLIPNSVTVKRGDTHTHTHVHRKGTELGAEGPGGAYPISIP
jgi:hypothetical protein